MGYCAPALGYVDFRLGGVGIGWIKSVWLFNFGFDKGRFKTRPEVYSSDSVSVGQSVS